MKEIYIDLYYISLFTSIFADKIRKPRNKGLNLPVKAQQLRCVIYKRS